MFIENTEELAQNKLILLYIIDQSNVPLTNEEITEFIMENNYMNYFLIQQYLTELIESEFIKYIDKEDSKKYTLSNKGKVTLSYFKDRISDKIKKEISNKFLKVEEEIKRAAQVVGEYFKKSDREYVTNLKLIEGNETLLSLSLKVTTIEQAERICNTWKNNTEYIYKTLFNILADDNIASIED